MRPDPVTDSATFTTSEANDEDLGDLLREVLPGDGSTIGKMSAREVLGRAAGRQVSEEKHSQNKSNKSLSKDREMAQEKRARKMGCEGFKKSLYFLICFSVLSAPSYAKSIWLQCGLQKVYLNADKNEYVVEDGITSFKGTALFFPNLVKLELMLREWSPSEYGIKYVWDIDRRTLQYNKTGSVNQDTKGFTTNRGWVKNSEEAGFCAKIKDPYPNTKI